MPTMSTVTVPAITDFEFQGKTFKKDDVVTCAPIDAAALARKGYVTLDRRAAEQLQARAYNAPQPEPIVTPEPEPEPVIAAAPPARRRRRSRTYKTRDMAAE